MSDPGFARPDLCSIRAAAEQVELAEAVRGGLSADGRTRRAADDPPAPLTSGIDRAIRLSTAAAVLAVAGIAAYVSYWHAYAVVRAHGESGITARLEPATIDGLVYASSMVVLYAARHRVPVPSLARWLLGLGIAATLTANMAQGWSHGPSGRWSRPGRRSASWARMSFLTRSIRCCVTLRWRDTRLVVRQMSVRVVLVAGSCLGLPGTTIGGMRVRAFPVRLPSGARYWTVLDDDLAVVGEADAFLRHVRFGRDQSESTTRAYAGEHRAVPAVVRADGPALA